MATTAGSQAGIARAHGGGQNAVADAAFVQKTQTGFDRLRATFLSGKTKTHVNFCMIVMS